MLWVVLWCLCVFVAEKWEMSTVAACFIFFILDKEHRPPSRMTSDEWFNKGTHGLDLWQQCYFGLLLCCPLCWSSQLGFGKITNSIVPFKPKVEARPSVFHVENPIWYIYVI